MISGVLIFNSSAELIISRFYRPDYSRMAAEAFRSKIIAEKNFTNPVLLLDKSSFMFVKFQDLIITAVAKRNVNTSLVFEFLYQLIHVFRSYFDGEFDEHAIRSNFVLVYELFDEVMDHGYPQVVNIDSLKQYIHHGEAKLVDSLESKRQNREITSIITGSCDWRQENKYFYQKNEVHLDVIEQVDVIINQQGKTLSEGCKGKITMKSALSGMPVCKFGLNDKVSMQKRKEQRGSSKKVSEKEAIDLEDVAFHRAVQLNRYDEDKTIMFTPPDGEFELMSYRIKSCNLPFHVTAMVSERGRNRVEYHVKIKGLFEPFTVAQDIKCFVPVPPNTSTQTMKCTSGKWKYIPGKSCILWETKRLSGGQSIVMKGDVLLTHLIQDKQWSRPPITMQFSIPMWAASGIKVRFLNVSEPKMGYSSIKWVRYVTHAGDYQIRI